jgi:hypothetical protein
MEKVTFANAVLVCPHALAVPAREIILQKYVTVALLASVVHAAEVTQIAQASNFNNGKFSEVF